MEIVSIHAPTRGATLYSDLSKIQSEWVSIHAPTRGATYFTNIVTLIYLFQFTHPRGVRRSVARWIDGHNPGFNSRTHAGCDKEGSQRQPYCPGFNSRTHAGCDIALNHSVNDTFVSIHAPTRGATALTPTCKPFMRVSIHAPTRGATACSQCWQGTLPFQFTHPRGVRQAAGGQFRNRAWCFNSRTHAGCDPPRKFVALASNVSIHAPTRGATDC